MPVRRIVVAVDGSEPADRALAMVAEQQGAERILAERAERLPSRGQELRTLRGMTNAR
jgi:hypothetical protein